MNHKDVAEDCSTTNRSIRKKIQDNWLFEWFKILPLAVLQTPRFADSDEPKRVMDWYLDPLQTLPSDSIPNFTTYCKEDHDVHQRAIDILEKKSDWLMTLTMSVVGVAVLRLTDSEHVRVERNSWVIAHVLAAWGMLFCLRARLPQKYPAPADAIALQKWWLDYEAWHKEQPNNPSMKDVSAMQVAKLYAYTSAVMKLIGEWKAKCVRGAGGLLVLAFLTLMYSFYVPTLDVAQGTPTSQHDDGRGGGGGVLDKASVGVRGLAEKHTPSVAAESLAD